MTQALTSTERRADVAVVGAGIVGLAHAYHLARKGLKVVVFERHAQAQGASVRNFGMVWPMGQPSGPWLDLALKSRGHWLEVLPAAGLWHNPCGSLHLAYREDEWAVLQEFARDADERGYQAKLLTAEEVLAKSPVVEKGLRGGLFSETEVCVDPREVIARLPAWLEKEHGVTFRFGQAVSTIDLPKIHAGADVWKVDRAIVAGGDDFETLFPEAFTDSGLVRCKLQMMRTTPQGGWKIGPLLATGPTLRHYRSFEHCPSLEWLKRRIAGELPDFEQFGIHIMASQNGHGEVVLGDSHEYGADATPFDNPHIDRLILDYVKGFLNVPDLTIAARWHGVYVKHPTAPTFTAAPQKGVRVVTGLGGAGMTLSFGVAEQQAERLLAE